MKYYITALIFLLSACKKEKIGHNVSCDKPTNDIIISKELITGKWIWVSELYREQVTGQLILKTPLTEGYTRQMLATTFVLEYFKDNIFEQKYLYEFVIESSLTNFPDDSTNVLVFKNYTTGQRSNYVHYSICNDTLVLNFQTRSSFAGIQKWVKNK